MPTYTFFNEDSGMEWDDMMSISEKENFLSKNPHIRQVPAALNIVGSVMGQKTMRNDSGFKENMQRIAEAHPTSSLAQTYGDKSSKAVKTRQAVEKWRSKRAKDTSV